MTFFINLRTGSSRTIHTTKFGDCDEKNGFYAAFYKNFTTGIGVLVIRGTDSLHDGLADAEYVMNVATSQYKEAKTFWHIMKDHYLFSDVKKMYLCGHSLGGIVAKMIAPMTGLDTIAFNSRDVKVYLINRHLPC